MILIDVLHEHIRIHHKAAGRTMKKKTKRIRNRESKKEGKFLPKRDDLCKKIIEYGILGLLVFSPLPAASVHEWSILVLQSTVLVMMAAYVLMREKPENNRLLLHSLKWPRYLFYGFFAFFLIQILPLPKFLVGFLSPSTYSFQKLFSTNFSNIKFMSISLIPSHTLKEGLELLAYFLLGFLIIKTVTQQKQIKRIFYTLVAVGIFEALYGFYELFNKNPRILFYKKIYGLDSVTGTFVNRNHFSGYLEMIIPLTIGLVLAHIDFFSLADLKWRERVLSLSKKRFYTSLLLSFGIIIMSLAIIFSKSRSGVFLLVFTFILFSGSNVIHLGRERHHRKRAKTFFKVLFSIVILFALYTGIDAVVERFALDKVLHENRPLYWSNTTQIVGNYPFFGSGLGTFASVYPAYEKALTSAHLSHAHNDFLEYLSELGTVGLLFLLGGILFMLINSVLIWRLRRRPEVRGLALGGIIAVICILIHSITDFNLHIPANMLLFTVVLAVTLVTAFYKRSDAIQVDEPIKARTSLRSMSHLKKALVLAGVTAIFIIDLAIYWNQHLWYRQQRTEEVDKKIRILEKANTFYSLNDLVYYELGKAYFDQGIQTLEEDYGVGTYYLQKSTQNFEHSLRLNPTSRFCHFYYAQSLFYMSYLDPSLNENFYEMYKKAALLAGHNSQIFYEVGKVFLSQWPKLSEENKKFTIDTLKKIISGADRTKLRTIMNIWEMSIKDYQIMQEILPEDTQIYRMYAEFLGEKSLSLEERQKALAKAEYLEFEKAKSDYKSGENELMYLRVRKASKYFRSCLNRLEKINFFQSLTASKPIQPSEFNQLKKQACLKLAKCHLNEGGELNDVEAVLRTYLELEESTASVGELESYLRRLTLIGTKLEDSLDNLERLSFHILLFFNQSRYGDIINVGNLLQKSYIIVPEAMKDDYLEVLQVVGDSYQKLDALYDAAHFYNTALDVNPENLNALLNLRLCYERMNKEEEIQNINDRIENLLTPRQIGLNNYLINKGRRFSQRMNLDDRKITLRLHFKNTSEEVIPLIAVFFNGRVVWEDYLVNETISIPLEPKIGENLIMVSPVNSSIHISDIKFETE